MRELRGVSTKQLAEQLGATQQQISKYELGKNRVSAGRLWEIAKILRTTIVYFYEGIDPVPARGRRGLAEDAAGFSGPISDAANELISAFERIEDEDIRTALITEAKKQAWVAGRSGGKSKS